MGQSNSSKCFSYVRSQGQMIDSINNEAKELSDRYTYEFLDDNFCNRVALIYNDKLTKFRKQEIDNVQFTLGIVNDDPTAKNQVCKLIVNHYIKRIQLIAKITQATEYAHNRILALVVGPKCQGQPEVFEESECQRLGGQWIETVLLPDDRVKENKHWYEQVHKMQTDYIIYLRKLKSILTQLNDYDKYVTDEKLHALDVEFDRLTHFMNERAFQAYREILATPTLTAQEAQARMLQEQSQSSDYLSKIAAYRTSKRLPPLRLHGGGRGRGAEQGNESESQKRQHRRHRSRHRRSRNYSKEY